ncbi:MAG: DUF488 domain-containing protein [Clostridiales bacterium]|jgi:hypothetical protein|nr:DUF488 domain-containing protein [Clostridiales bacterium]
MNTGYFGAVKKYPQELRYISIARFNRFWSGEKYIKLAPPPELLKIYDYEEYKKLYRTKVLDKLNPYEVYADLGDLAVLLCYEKWADVKQGKSFCHRRLVAEWLEENIMGLKVDELEV